MRIKFSLIFLLFSAYAFSQQDSIRAINHDDRFYVSLGLGTTEFTNLNLGVHIHYGFYATANLGITFVNNGETFWGLSRSTFYKVGITWRASSSESTFWGSFEVGRAKLDVQESYSTLFIPNQATLASLLAGYEWRSNSGLNLGLRGGIKYSKIETKEVQYWPGLQISVGYWLF